MKGPARMLVLTVCPLLLFLLTFSRVAAHASSADITISSDSEVYHKGDTVTVSIEIEADVLPGDFEGYLLYPEDVLTYVSGPGIVSGGEGILKINDQVDSETRNSRKYSLKFKAEGLGNAEISLRDDPELYEYEEGGYSLGTYIEITSGKVEPEKDEVPTPTEKVTPTDGPTPAVTPGPEPTGDITPVPTGDVTPTPDPDEEPKDTPFPTEMLLPLPTGSAVTDDGTVYDMFGNELETVTNTYSSKYDMKGIVTADLLNLRESPSLDCDVLGIISKDAVVSLVGTRTNSIDFDGVGRQVRWYRVLALIEVVYDGSLYTGYVNSIYVDADSSVNMPSTTNTQVLSSASFEEELAKEGFPDSYKPFLPTSGWFMV